MTYLIRKTGKITAIVGNDGYVVMKDHTNYNEILNAVLANDCEQLALLAVDVKTTAKIAFSPPNL